MASSKKLFVSTILSASLLASCAATPVCRPFPKAPVPVSSPLPNVSLECLEAILNGMSPSEPLCTESVVNFSELK